MSWMYVDYVGPDEDDDDEEPSDRELQYIEDYPVSLDGWDDDVEDDD